MKNFHVISTGTSILANFSREANKERKFKDVHDKYLMKDWATLNPNDQRQKDIEAYIPEGNEVHETLYEFIKKDPKSASAELNSFLSFIKEYGQSKDSIELALYCTDTANNRLCAQLVYEYLQEEGFRMVGEPIKIKGISALRDFESGLLEILDKVVRIIVDKSKQGYDIFISATAGFKPETTFFVIAASLCSLKSPTVYYIHESFKSIVTLPLLPLQVPEEYLKIAEEFKEPKHQNEVLDILNKKFNRGYDYFVYLLNNRILEQTSDFMIKTSTWLRKILEIKNSY
jgi:putative CRISPR-associated protein (TIGR02619 family)